jgi:hypothetical protein
MVVDDMIFWERRRSRKKRGFTPNDSVTQAFDARQVPYHNSKQFIRSVFVTMTVER